MKEQNDRLITEACLRFIDKSPSSFHAVYQMAAMLKEAGFEELREQEAWMLSPGKRYYVTRNSSSLIAFSLPQERETEQEKLRGFHIAAAHSDSPSFKIKPGREVTDSAYVRLNTEKYGGMILSSWLDRGLSVAGRLVTEEAGRLTEHLVDVDRDLLVIPNVAIHMNREMNKGTEYNPQTDMLPLFAGKEAEEKGKRLLELLAEEAGVSKEQILGSDLYLYVRQKGCFVGADEEFILSPRLDDLECAYAAVQGIIQAVPEQYAAVCAVFDSEEVGSQTRQGAGSTFLKDTLERIGEALQIQGSAWKRLLAESFLLSADNAHARHPAHPQKADPVNAPVLNGGVVIKYHGGQKYMTDAVSEAVFQKLCREAQVPVQLYTNRSDIPGGSTLGNIVMSQVPVSGVDIGLPQLAMHSAVETAGSRDLPLLCRLMTRFFKE